MGRETIRVAAGAALTLAALGLPLLWFQAPETAAAGPAVAPPAPPD